MKIKFCAVVMYLLCSGLVYSSNSISVKADEGDIFAHCMDAGFNVRNAELKAVCRAVENVIDQRARHENTSLPRFIQSSKANCIEVEGDVGYCDESERLHYVFYNAFVVASCGFEGVAITHKDYDWQLTQHYGTVYEDYDHLFSCKRKQHLGYSEEYLIHLGVRLDYDSDYEPTELVDQFIEAISAGNQLSLKPLLAKIRFMSDADIYYLQSQMFYYESLNVTMLKSMVEHGFPIENRLHYYHQPLVESVRANRPEIADWLIKQGASLNALDEHGNTLITVATGAGNRLLVEMLVAKGIPLDGQQGTENPHKFTPLKAAAKGGHAELVRYLYQQGVKVSADDFLNKQDGAEPNSLLYYAVSGGNVDVVQDLIRWGAEIDQEDGLTSSAVLAIIEGEGDVRILDVLFDAGVKDRSSNALALLLSYAISDHLVETEDARLFDAVHVVEQLVKNGAKIEGFKKRGRSVNLLRELLRGMSYNWYLDRTGEEDKAYGRWLRRFIEFSAQLFIQEGVAVKGQDAHGQTALHDSAGKCYPKVTSLLLQAGADTEVVDKRGEKPVDKVLHVLKNLSRPRMANSVQYAQACQQTLQLLQ